FTSSHDHPILTSSPTRRSSDLIEKKRPQRLILDAYNPCQTGLCHRPIPASRLPSRDHSTRSRGRTPGSSSRSLCRRPRNHPEARSEEHTSELQSRENLVCRLLL